MSRYGVASCRLFLICMFPGMDQWPIMILSRKVADNSNSSDNCAHTRQKRFLWPLLLTVAATTLLAVLPHLISKMKFGDWSFWSNSDNFVYMAFHKANYFGSWHFNDPYRPAFEQGPVLYSWLHTVPVSQLVYWLGWGPDELNFLWRLAGGAALGGSVFLLVNHLFRQFQNGPLLACAASLIFVADPGSIDGRSFLQPLLIAFQRATHPAAPVGDDLVLPFFRVITPLTNYFLPMLALLALLKSQSRRWAVGAGVLLGLNILTYFFYWTVLIPIFGLSALYFLVMAYWKKESAGADKKQFLNITIALMIGGTIGLPDVVLKRSIQHGPGAQEILDRLCRGQVMPAGDPIRSMYLFNKFYFLEMAVLAACCVMIGKKRLWLLWGTSAFAFVMTNSALATGMEFENWHWRYLSHPMVELGLLYGICQWASERAWGRNCIYAASAFYVLLGFGLRAHDVLRAEQPARYRQMQSETGPLLTALQALKLDANAALVGPGQWDWLALYTPAFQLYQEPYSAHISMLSDAEVVRRHALNAYLQGLDREAYLKLDAPRMCGGCSVLKPAWQPDEVRRARVAAFLNLTDAEARQAVADYSAVIVLCPAPEGPPPHCGPWSEVARSGTWVMWRMVR